MPDYSGYIPATSPAATNYPSLIGAFMNKVGDDLEYMTWDVRIDEDYKLIFGSSYESGAGFYWDSTSSSFKWTYGAALYVELEASLGKPILSLGGTGLSTGADLLIGENDVGRGYLALYGGGTATVQGGKVGLFVCSDYDSPIDSFTLEAHEDDLRIGPVSGPYFQFEGTPSEWSFANTLSQATGNQTALSLEYEVDKATSGSDFGLYLNKTDTASPGDSYLAWFGVDGDPICTINDSGTLSVADVYAGSLGAFGGVTISGYGDGDDIFIKTTDTGSTLRNVIVAVGGAATYPVMYYSGTAYWQLNANGPVNYITTSTPVNSNSRLGFHYDASHNLIATVKESDGTTHTYVFAYTT